MGAQRCPSESVLRDHDSPPALVRTPTRVANDLVQLQRQETQLKHIALGINIALVFCKGVALFLCWKHAIAQSLFDSLGDVLGNIAVIAFRDEIGVLLQAMVMGSASIGVIVRAATSLLEIAGFIALQNGNDHDSDSERSTAVLLILVAILTKGLVYARCRMLTSCQSCSLAVNALQEDAMNDVVMNSGALLCAFPELWLALLGSMIPKTLEFYMASGMDPTWAFLMSWPILHGWVVTGWAQIVTLREEQKAALKSD